MRICSSSAEGGNRTGRIFTGDQSAKFLIEQLYHAQLANQPTSLSSDDGLQLQGCYLTASVKCVPPDHRPSPLEIRTCSRYLQREIEQLRSLKSVLVLGEIALNAYKQYLDHQNIPSRHLLFKHGACYCFDNSPTLFICGREKTWSFRAEMNRASCFQIV